MNCDFCEAEDLGVRELIVHMEAEHPKEFEVVREVSKRDGGVEFGSDRQNAIHAWLKDEANKAHVDRLAEAGSLEEAGALAREVADALEGDVGTKAGR